MGVVEVQMFVDDFAEAKTERKRPGGLLLLQFNMDNWSFSFFVNLRVEEKERGRWENYNEENYKLKKKNRFNR